MIEDKNLILVHIPKTAGSSLSSILYSMYKPEEIYSVSNPKINVTESITENTKCFLGHNLYGQHQEWGPCIYITMLRDPIDRVISHYYYVKHFVNDSSFVNKSLDEFVELDRFSNMQTRFITGGNLDLKQAINNLENFEFYGITEKFAESLFLLKMKFGLKEIKYLKKNVNSERPNIKNVSSRIIEKIRNKNEVDINLYQWAKGEFESKIKSLDESLKSDLENWINSI